MTKQQTELAERFEQTRDMRAVAVRRMGWLCEDAAAEVSAVVWELLVAGETDLGRLYCAAVDRLKRRRRSERRSNARLHLVGQGEVALFKALDPMEECERSVVAAGLIARWPPSEIEHEAVASWLAGERSLPAKDRARVHRWLNRIREATSNRTEMDHAVA